MLTAQALIDWLVIAAEEQDVLYVLHWIDEMKRQKCMDTAINGKHSWKGYSAIGSIILSPFTQFRELLLEILLLEGEIHESEDVLELAMDLKNKEVIEFLLSWATGRREKATDARHLLVLPLESAADWIDSNLPRPPNWESLTGDGPLPTAPPSVPSPLFETIISANVVDLSAVPTEGSNAVPEAANLDSEEDKIKKDEIEEGEIVQSSKRPREILESTAKQRVSPQHLPHARFRAEMPNTTLETRSSDRSRSPDHLEPVAKTTVKRKPWTISTTAFRLLSAATRLSTPHLLPRIADIDDTRERQHETPAV